MTYMTNHKVYEAEFNETEICTNLFRYLYHKYHFYKYKKFKDSYIKINANLYIFKSLILI